MSLSQLSQNKSISKDGTSQLSNKNDSFDINKTKNTLTSITHTEGTEIYNDPVFQNNKGLPFTKEDQKRFLKEANRKNVCSIAYIGKCIIFYCTLYSIYALLGISVMYLYMLGSWNSNIPNLTGKGSFIGLPGINMIPKLETKRENPIIKYNINDKNSYVIYTNSIMQFFAKVYNASQTFNNETINKKQYENNKELKSNNESKDVFKTRRKRNEIDEESINKTEINSITNNDNKTSNDKSSMYNKEFSNTEEKENISKPTDIKNKNNSTTLVDILNGETNENVHKVNNINEKSLYEKNETITNEKILENPLKQDEKIENFNTTNNSTFNIVEKNNETNENLTITNNVNTNNQQNKSKDNIKEELLNKKDSSFNCSHENDYGYSIGEPCIIIYLNNVLKWEKPVFNKSNIPKNYQKDFHNFLNETTLNYIIPVNCQLKGKEQESQKYFSYLFPGIIDQNGYYPVTKNSDILKKPYMMVQLKNIPKNENLQVFCRYYVDVEVSTFEEDAMTFKFNVNISQ
uniref:Sodium/potassium-transporting ATPase subunit beta n=1 Tax=Strongyloides stercoralis TaxID=6248 RepID=A0AAF5DF00_STRER